MENRMTEKHVGAPAFCGPEQMPGRVRITHHPPEMGSVHLAHTGPGWGRGFVRQESSVHSGTVWPAVPPWVWRLLQEESGVSGWKRGV